MFGRDVVSGPANARGKFAIFLLENVQNHATGLESLLALSSGVNDANGRTPVVSEGGKLAAAVALKNGIKKRWTVDENEEDDAKRIEAPAKERLRSLVLEKAGRDEFKSTGEEPTCRSAASDSDDGFSVHEEFPSRKWPNSYRVW